MRFGLGILVFFSFVCSAQTEMRGSSAPAELRGLEWEDDEYHQLPLKLSYFKPSSNLPGSVSLKKYCPRVVNQANVNMGVAWETVWYARTILQAAGSGWQDLATVTKNAFSPGFNYRKCFAGHGCDAPVKLSAVLSSLVWDGALPFTEFPDICPADSASSDEQAAAAKNRMPGFVRLFNSSDAKEIKIRTIKEAIAGNHPVVVGIICPPSFSLANEFWQPREDPDRGAGGHALCVVGYDDKAYGGAFEIVNSWGRTWGAQGFTWLRYEDVNKFVMYGFELIGPEAPIASGLKASITFTQTDGTPMAAAIRNDGPEKRGAGYYKLVKSYSTGTAFQLRTESNTDLFLYAIMMDDKRNHQFLFPSEKSIYPWLTKSERTLVLPDLSRSITLTDPPGKNYILMIFSGREIKKEELIRQLKEGTGDFPQAFHSGKLISGNVSWTQDVIAFTSEWNSDTMVAVVIEIDQVH